MAFVPVDQIKESLKTTGKYWISFTGDSITSCEWVHPNWRDIVIFVLQNELTQALQGDWVTAEWGIRGFNFAYSGATTKDVYEKLDDTLLPKPELVISLMGSNDHPLGVSVEDSVMTIQKIAGVVVSSGSKLVWCSSTPAGKGSPKNSEYEPYAQALKRLASTDDFYNLDVFHLYQDFPTERFFTFLSEENPVEHIKAGDPDLQHPNQLGNAYIAKILLKEVFGIEFDPERYIADTLAGKKLPEY